MHPINHVLAYLGLGLHHKVRVPLGFYRTYRRDLERARAGAPHLAVFEDFQYDAGGHPEDFSHAEASFVARHLFERAPSHVLDIGSHRHFVLGLLAGMRVTTVDVRRRRLAPPNESVLTCDVRQLDLPSGSFDAVVSVSTLEHVGLGRYGDPFDLDGDKKAIAEMIRVLRPGGVLLFTTTITGAAPSIAFNAHRIYDRSALLALSVGTRIIDELFYSHEHGPVPLERITTRPRAWDVYCGCWERAETTS